MPLLLLLHGHLRSRQIEAHGDLAIEQGDKSLRESGFEGLGEAEQRPRHVL